MQLNPLAIEAEVRSSSILFGRGARCRSTLWQLRRRCEAAPSFSEEVHKAAQHLAIKAKVKAAPSILGRGAYAGRCRPALHPAPHFWRVAQCAALWAACHNNPAACSQTHAHCTASPLERRCLPKAASLQTTPSSPRLALPTRGRASSWRGTLLVLMGAPYFERRLSRPMCGLTHHTLHCAQRREIAALMAAPFFCAVLAQCMVAISVNFRCSGCRVASTLHTACCAQRRLLSGPVGSSIACRSRLPSLAQTMKAYQTAS